MTTHCSSSFAFSFQCGGYFGSGTFLIPSFITFPCFNLDPLTIPSNGSFLSLQFLTSFLPFASLRNPSIRQMQSACIRSISTLPYKKDCSCRPLSERPLERDSWTSSSPTAAVFLFLFLSHPLLTNFLLLVILPCSTQHPQASINNSSTQVTERASRMWALLTGGRATRLAGFSLQRPVAVQSAHSKGGVPAMIDRMLVECFRCDVVPFSATWGRCGMFVDATTAFSLSCKVIKQFCCHCRRRNEVFRDVWLKISLRDRTESVSVKDATVTATYSN